MATSAEARRYQAYAARIRDAWRHGRLDAGQVRRLEAAGFEFEPRRLSGVVRIEDGRRFDTLKAAHDETGASVGRISVAARSAEPWRRVTGGAHWISAGRWDALDEQGRRRLQGLVEGERLRGLWVCVETGEAYDTMMLAAEAHGMPVSRLQKRNRLDRRNGGVHWVDGVTYGRIRRRHPGLLAAWRRTMRETRLRGPVVCVETGVEYGDAMRAAETLTLTGRTRNTPGMRDLINHVRDNPDRRAGGFHWASPEWLGPAGLGRSEAPGPAEARSGAERQPARHPLRGDGNHIPVVARRRSRIGTARRVGRQHRACGGRSGSRRLRIPLGEHRRRRDATGRISDAWTGAGRGQGACASIGSRYVGILPCLKAWDSRISAIRLVCASERLHPRQDSCRDILPRLMRGGGFLLKNPSGFSIDRLSPHALWFARFMSRATR